jgi:hypothetical protein
MDKSFLVLFFVPKARLFIVPKARPRHDKEPLAFL